MSYFALKNGEKIYYEDTGEGDNVLVMLHGWTSSHSVYEEPVALLKKKARCVIYDHRGHGGSKEANSGSPDMKTLASDLHELLTGLDLENVNLLGWSMGAGVVMTYLEEFGTERLKSVILCDMSPKQMNDDEWKLGLYKGAYTQENVRADAGKPFFKLYREFAVAAIPKLGSIPGFLVNPKLKKRLKECDESVLRSLSVSMKSQDHRESFKGLTIPLSYFYADPGSLFSSVLAEWYAKNVPTFNKAVKFENATHMFISEQPGRFAEEVAMLL